MQQQLQDLAAHPPAPAPAPAPKPAPQPQQPAPQQHIPEQHGPDVHGVGPAPHGPGPVIPQGPSQIDRNREIERQRQEQDRIRAEQQRQIEEQRFRDQQRRAEEQRIRDEQRRIEEQRIRDQQIRQQQAELDRQRAEIAAQQEAIRQQQQQLQTVTASVLFTDVTRKTNGEWLRINLLSPKRLSQMSITVLSASVEIHQAIVYTASGASLAVNDLSETGVFMSGDSRSAYLGQIQDRIVAIDVRAESWGRQSTLSISATSVEGAPALVATRP